MVHFSKRPKYKTVRKHKKLQKHTYKKLRKYTYKKSKGGYEETIGNTPGIRITNMEFEQLGYIELNDTPLVDYFEKNNEGYQLKNEYLDFIEQIKKIFKITFIAKGSFGAVYKAFPNTNQTFNNVEDKVVKMYFTEDAYKKEIDRQALIKSIIKSQSFDIKKYNKSIKRNNISSRMNMKNLPRDLYMIQMPNLGNDIFEIYNNRVNLSNIPGEKLAREILKLLHVVNEINIGKDGNSYIHGDIRDTNVLINLNGDMTIIDFDLFDTMDAFYEKYIKFGTSIHMPLECIIVQFLKRHPGYSLTELNSKIDKILIYMLKKESLVEQWKNQRTDKGDNIHAYTTTFLNKIRDARKKEMSDARIGYNMIKDNIDLYGLGTCLKYLMYINNSIPDIVKTYIDDTLLPNIMDGYPGDTEFTRWSIKEAIENYSKCLIDNGIKIPQQYSRKMINVPIKMINVPIKLAQPTIVRPTPPRV